MSTKTTFVLAIALVCVVFAFLIAERVGKDNGNENANTAPTQTTGVERPLAPDDFGEVVKIVCEVKGQPRWVFEVKDAEAAGPSAAWTMTEPAACAVQDWLVRSIASTLKRLKYTIVHKAGDPQAVSTADAGLDPPRAVVTLTDTDDKTFSVRVGRDASSSSAYVQLTEGGDIYRVDASLKKLLKDTALDYRNLRVNDFAANQAVKLDITSRTEGEKPEACTLVKSGGTWVFETPFRCNAVDTKVNEFLTTLGMLNVSQWVADSVDNPAGYGLGEPKLTIAATVEETVEPTATEDAATNGAKPEPQVQTVVHTVSISALSPIGDENKFYARKDGDPAVATVVKNAVERVEPKLDEWRDLTVTTANVTAATRIEIATADETGVLEKHGKDWRYAVDQAPADATEIKTLLDRIKNLKARNFVEGAGSAPDKFGLHEPQATLTLTLPGQGEPERLTVGAFADERTKRLVYVRRGDNDIVAKVRISDAQPLLRGLAEYRDRKVFDYPVERIERIEIDRLDPVKGGRSSFALAREDDTWRMVHPVNADCEEQAANELAQSLAGLRADKVEAVAGDPATYGLDEPAITVSLTYQPPEITKLVEVEPALPAVGTSGLPTPEFKEERVVPPAETYSLALVEHDGKVYAKRSDSAAVYSLAKKTYEALEAEYHAKRIFSIEQSQVTAISVATADGEDGFVKEDGEWKYASEPDIPIDTKKVENLVVQLADLKVSRYAEYGVADLSSYGLDDPSHTVTVRADEKETVLLVSKTVCENVPGNCHYAVLAGSNDVFLVTPNTISRFTISLDMYEIK